MSQMQCLILGVVCVVVNIFMPDNIFYLSGIILFGSSGIINAIERTKS